jgi:hypothetical protein
LSEELPDEFRQAAGDLEVYSSGLDWKEFEVLAERAFKSFGMRTKRNYVMTRPRMEIDLVAVKGSAAFAVDCKHWRRSVGRSKMVRVSQEQVRRCRQLLRKERKLDSVVPLVLTWRDESLYVLENGVPIVPIARLSSFLLEWEGHSDSILTIRRGRRG